jgi:hypothetical protein
MWGYAIVRLRGCVTRAFDLSIKKRAELNVLIIFSALVTDPIGATIALAIECKELLDCAKSCEATETAGAVYAGTTNSDCLCDVVVCQPASCDFEFVAGVR